MPDEVMNPSAPTAPTAPSELEDALTALDAALEDAARSVAAIRGNIARVGVLEAKVQEMEAAIARARRDLSLPSTAGARAQPSPQLHAVPSSESALPVEGDATGEGQAGVADVQAEPVATPASSEAELDSQSANCLRLGVSSKSGSLDLKAVDGAVNEVPAVADVALLDYDGRQATLKLWINGSANPDEVQESLLASLRSRLGGEEDAELTIKLEEKSAA